MQMLHVGSNHSLADGHSDRLSSLATCKPAAADLLAQGSSCDGGGCCHSLASQHNALYLRDQKGRPLYSRDFERNEEGRIRTVSCMCLVQAEPQRKNDGPP